MTLAADTTALKSDIDRLVFQLYGLTEDEPAVAVPVGRNDWLNGTTVFVA